MEDGSIDLQALLFGHGPYERFGAPEPTLLPYLAAMVHDQHRDRVWSVAQVFGLSGSTAPPWPPLWQAVVAVAPMPAGSEPAWPTYPFSIGVTELPTRPGDERRARADELAEELHRYSGGPWYAALAVSRLAPFASSGRSWPVTGEPLWDDLIARLATSVWPEEPFGDVLRAHPFAADLLRVHGRHETAVAAVDVILDRWGGSAQAGPPETAGAELDPITGETPPVQVGSPPEPEPATAAPAPEPAAAEPPPFAVPPPPPPPPPMAARKAELRRAPVPAPDPSPGKRRLQADVIAGDRLVTSAFVAGTVHQVEISVGRQAAIHAGEVFPPVPMPEDVDRVRLTVRFAAQGKVQESTIVLPRDESRESSAATFELAVPADARQVSALVVVYLDTEVLQGAVLSGPVVATLEDVVDSAGAITLDVGAFVKELVPASTSSATASIVADATTALAASPGGTVAIDVSALRNEVADLAERIDSGAELLFQGDEDEIERLFRDLALHGRRLRAVVAEQLGADLWAASHLQVVTLSAGAFLPLELVYDGPQPTSRSKLCGDWREAALAGTCTACSPKPRLRAPKVCPSHFWGLSKVIERHSGLGGRAGSFEVRSERREGLTALAPLVGAVVGASGKVEADDLTSVVTIARKTFKRARKASSWSEWTSLIREARPGVLVALPHHEEDSSVDPALSCLELGTSLLPAGGIELGYVGDNRPGPVVLLVGCNTALDRTPIDSFAGEFRAAGASVVVATLGPVIPEEAARAAEAVVRALGEAMEGAGDAATFGEVMLQARRALVGEGLVLGLLLVANGDADWRLG